jgi:cell wall-associated NlpC family hydrolase
MELATPLSQTATCRIPVVEPIASGVLKQWLTARAPRAFAALALAAAMTACASSGAVPRPFPAPQGSQGTQAPRDSRDVEALVGTALSLRGVRYRNGGASPSGFDCSGFTQYVFSHHGVALPRDTHDQFQQGKPVRAGDVAPGDLLFFTTTGPGPTHVAIAVGGGRFIHAPSSAGVVRVERLGASYWSARYVGAPPQPAAANSQLTTRN